MRWASGNNRKGPKEEKGKLDHEKIKTGDTVSAKSRGKKERGMDKRSKKRGKLWCSVPTEKKTMEKKKKKRKKKLGRKKKLTLGGGP